MGKRILWHLELPIGTGELSQAFKIMKKLADQEDIDEIHLLSGSASAVELMNSLTPAQREKIKLIELPRLVYDSPENLRAAQGQQEDPEFEVFIERMFNKVTGEQHIIVPHRLDERKQEQKYHLTEDGTVIGDAKYSAEHPDNAERERLWKEWRKQLVLKHLKEFDPDMLIISYWPFANGHIVDEECLALLEHTQHIPRIATTREVVLADTPPVRGDFRRLAPLLYRKFDQILILGPELLNSVIENIANRFIPRKMQPDGHRDFQLSDHAGAVEVLKRKSKAVGWPVNLQSDNEEIRHDGDIIVSCGLDWYQTAEDEFWAVLALAESGNLPDLLKGRTWRFFIPNHDKVPKTRRQLLVDAAESCTAAHIVIEPTDAANFHKYQRNCAFSFQLGGNSSLAEMVNLGKRFYATPVQEGSGAYAEQQYRLKRCEELGICQNGAGAMMASLGAVRKNIAIIDALRQQHPDDKDPFIDFLRDKYSWDRDFAIEFLRYGITQACEGPIYQGRLDCNGVNGAAEAVMEWLQRGKPGVGVAV